MEFLRAKVALEDLFFFFERETLKDKRRTPNKTCCYREKLDGTQEDQDILFNDSFLKGAYESL